MRSVWARRDRTRELRGSRAATAGGVRAMEELKTRALAPKTATEIAARERDEAYKNAERQKVKRETNHDRQKQREEKKVTFKIEDDDSNE